MAARRVHTFLRLVVASTLLSACGQTEPVGGERPAARPPTAKIAAEIAAGDAALGRALFIEKGCVICHAVRGVGGKAAPALDAPAGAQANTVEFAARMWRGAPAMVELQALELGHVIALDADELLHLAAFAADAEAQATLTLADVPPMLRESFLDEQFWETEDWGPFLRRGQEDEGAGQRADED